MTLLSDLDISRCAECGKLFRGTPGEPRCGACSGSDTPSHRGSLRSLTPKEEQIVALLNQEYGIHPEVIVEVLEENDLWRFESDPGDAARDCVQCGRHRAVEGSDFCLHCSLGLYSVLGQASRDLFSRLELLEGKPGGPSSVISAYESKRSRTATSRIQAAPPNIKPY